MRAHKLQVQVPLNHRLSLKLPESFPTGPAEVTILTRAFEPRIFRAGGYLSSQVPPVIGDPIAEALRELRAERAEKIESLALDLESKDS